MDGLNIGAVWEEYQLHLRRFLLSRVSNSMDVDDLLQEVFMKTLKNLHTLHSSDSLKSWVFQIANRVLIDFYRRQNRLSDLGFDMGLNPSQKVDPESLELLGECVLPFIRALPKNDADLLMAIEIRGESQKDYAEILGIPYSTLKSRVQKSRRLLRHMFEDCCSFALDVRGSIVDFQCKLDSCKDC